MINPAYIAFKTKLALRQQAAVVETTQVDVATAQADALTGIADAAVAQAAAATGIADAAVAQAAAATGIADAGVAQTTAEAADVKAESALQANASLTPPSQVAMPYVYAIGPNVTPPDKDIEVACATPVAAINYRINGGSYLLYAGVITAAPGAVVDIYASKGGLTDSAILTLVVP